MNLKIVRKNVVRLSIRVKRDGTVILNVPLNTKDDIAIGFFNKHIDWINKSIEKLKDDTLSMDINNNGYIYYLGKKYQIKVYISNSEYTILNDDYIIIYSKNLDTDHLTKLLNKFLDEKRSIIYKECINKYLNILNLSINKLIIKNLKSSLGRCYKERKEIILSKSLIHKSISYIEAVCLHEVCHLKEANHQKGFYNLIYSVMPDYRIRLKQYEK